jgi:hypothetical protein
MMGHSSVMGRLVQWFNIHLCIELNAGVREFKAAH